MQRVYEGMFLVHPMLGEGVQPVDPVQRVLGRAGAEVLVCKKWDERRLAYDIRNQKRGVYVLSYFKVDGDRIPDIERDVQLADDLLRVLIVRADDVTKEQMEAPTPVESGRRAEEFEPDRDRDRDRDRRDEPRRPSRRDRPARSAPPADEAADESAGESADAGASDA